MDPLSAVANIAALIGLLELSCRVGKKTYELISAIKHASEEVAKLKIELEEIEFLMVNLTRYCRKYQYQHPLTVPESHSALERICDILRGLRVEYGSIEEIIKKNTLTRAGARDKLRGIKEKMRFAIGGKLAASQKILERYKLQLSSSLQILAGFNDLAMYDRIGKLAHTFSGLGHATQPTADSAPLMENTSLAKTKKPANHEKSSIRAPNDRNDSCWMGDEEMRSAVLPLMLLKPNIEEALHLFLSQRSGQTSLSSQDAAWIGDELKNLLAKCHESAATNLRKQELDDMKPHVQSHGLHKTAINVTGLDFRNQTVSVQNEEITSASCLLQESPTGKTSVRLKFIRNVQSGDTTISDVLLLLAPNPSISRDGVIVSLSRLHSALKQPKIQRWMSTFPVVEPNSPGFACVKLNDIEKLRTLLKTRQVSPSMRSTENESLLSLAARLLRFEMCELLLNEGADPNNCRSDGASAIYDVRNAFWYRQENHQVPKALLSQILRLLIRSGCDVNSVALAGSPLHFTISPSISGAEDIQETEIATLVNLIICLGGEIEYRNTDGLTPLLHNACNSGVHGNTVLRELLQWGADPHAQTLLGEGALHLAIAYSVPVSGHDIPGLRSLQGRLELLLQAGCDPGLKEGKGHTPSDFALSSPRIWFQWCFAIVKIENLSIAHILGQQFLLSDQNGTTHAEKMLDSNQGELVDQNSSDWEFCSDSGDELCHSKDIGSARACSDSKHIFISWDGKFPWSVDPSCADCGQLCRDGDIQRRKWAAWGIFQGLLRYTQTSKREIL